MADPRPPEFNFSFTSIFSFPTRFCHPPHPTATKIRSCSIVPVFQVSLDDVLDRRHLPPLGLKDFEEWLLFVEKRSQYLYFVLWLREYTQRYTQWSKSSCEKTRTGTRPISGSLSIFYTRAKQTFLSRQSPYYLSDLSEFTLNQLLRPPMDSPTDSPHPHPSAFTRIESEVRAILSQSLKAFVRASYANVSTYRAICGIIVGTIITLFIGLLPLLLTIFLSSNRWVRCVAWPGLTAGISIVIASSYGVCVGIYIFGDARQLRDFELLRPTIEKTPALAIKPIMPISGVPTPLSPAEVIRQQWSEQSARERRLTSSMISIHSALTSENHVQSSRSDSMMEIYISPAMDPDTGEYSPTTSLPRVDLESHEPQEFSGTATFIPHDPHTNDENQMQESKFFERKEQQFDFNGLPPLRSDCDCLEKTDPVPSTSDFQPASAFKCVDINVNELESGAESRMATADKTNAQTQIPVLEQQQQPPEPRYGNVAIFGPLTRILNPTIIRAQWEILVRSTVIGSLISLAIVGALVGIPEVKFMTTMHIMMISRDATSIGCHEAFGTTWREWT